MRDILRYIGFAAALVAVVLEESLSVKRRKRRALRDLRLAERGTAIPRPSKKERQAANRLKKWADFQAKQEGIMHEYVNKIDKLLAS